MEGAATPEQKEAAYYDIMRRGLDLGIPPNEMNKIKDFGAMYIAKTYGKSLQPEKKVTSAEQIRHVQSAETFIFGKTEMVKQTVPDKTGKMVTQEVSQPHVNPAIQSINASEHAVSQSLGRDFALKAMFKSGDEKYPGLWDAWLRFRRVKEAQGVKPEDAARYWMMQLDMIGGDVLDAWTTYAPKTKTWGGVTEEIAGKSSEAIKTFTRDAAPSGVPPPGAPPPEEDGGRKAEWQEPKTALELEGLWRTIEKVLGTGLLREAVASRLGLEDTYKKVGIGYGDEQEKLRIAYLSAPFGSSKQTAAFADMIRPVWEALVKQGKLKGGAAPGGTTAFGALSDGDLLKTANENENNPEVLDQIRAEVRRRRGIK